MYDFHDKKYIEKWQGVRVTTSELLWEHQCDRFRDAIEDPNVEQRWRDDAVVQLKKRMDNPNYYGIGPLVLFNQHDRPSL
jgi:hypothetical protein